MCEAITMMEVSSRINVIEPVIFGAINRERKGKLSIITVINFIKVSSWRSCNQQLSHYCVKCLNNDFNESQLFLGR